MNQSPDPSHILVVAAVVARDDTVLICRRPTHKHHGGLWEFPGGKLHKGEDFAAALQRELAEELGVQAAKIGDPLFRSVDDSARVQIVFIPAAIVGEPQALEHSEIMWCERSRLTSFDLAPSDRAFVNFLTGRDP